MTIDEAVAILNEHRHRGAEWQKLPFEDAAGRMGWFAGGFLREGSIIVDHLGSDYDLTSFEAIAVAKAYRAMDLEAAGFTPALLAPPYPRPEFYMDPEEAW